MAEKVQHIIFKGSGLNSDDSEEYFDNGDSKERRNVVPATDDGGRLETVLGNLERDDGYDPYYTISASKVLGYATDHENDKIYYFLQGTAEGGNLNSILEFDPLVSADWYTKVLWEETALEFEQDRLIKGAEVVDGWIYYNGYSHGLKKVNIDFGKNFTDYSYWESGGDYEEDDVVRVMDGRIYTCISAIDPSNTDPRDDAVHWSASTTLYTYPCDTSGNLEAISLERIHMPPTTPITYTYDSDTDKQINNLRGKLFQFTYRYKYREHGYSRTAPISSVTLPEDDENIKGEVVNEITTNNHLDLTFQAGDLGVVEWVELFVREGNSGTWYYVKRFESGEEVYAFYNDIALEAMEDDEINTMADAIPKEVNAERYISENVMLTAGNTEGYDNITLDVTMDYGFEEVELVTMSGAPQDTFTITEEVAHIGNVYAMFECPDVENDTSQGDYVHIYATTSNPAVTVDTGFVFQNANGGGNEDTDFRNECVAAINGAGTSMIAGTNDFGIWTDFDATEDFWICVPAEPAVDYDETNSYIKTYTSTAADSKKWGGFKTGATHKLGIQYYDEQMRPFAVQASGDTEIYVPTVPEANGAGSALDDEYKWRSYLTWEIDHHPPTGAAYWQWVYAGNSNISNFWTYVLDRTLGAEDTDATYGVGAGGTDYTCLDIGPLMTHSTIYPRSDLSYTWQEGDRVRILTIVSTVANTYGDLVAFANISDVETVTYDEATMRLVLPYDSGGNQYHAGHSSLIEIYRPRTTAQESIYYTIGSVYETYTNGGELCHRGVSADQTAAGASADGTLTRGDVYFISRGLSEIIAGGGAITTPYLVETPSYSDFYDSDDYDYGKINIESDLGETFLNDIRWTNTFVQDTYINGLCTYDAGDYISLPNRNGEIQALEQIGDTLRVYQEDKTTSVWIGRTEYTDTAGVSTVATSLSVLGSMREQVLEYGTLNPESITKTDKYVYGFDVQNGVFWRDSINGLFPISGKETTTGNDYKMESYFEVLSKALLESGISNVNVLTEWDGKYKLLYVTFEDSDDATNNETLAFHEPTNRWYSFFDHKDGSDNFPDCYARYKNYFYSFLSGELWEHYASGADRATFYGEKHDVVIDVVANQEPQIVKIFEAIGLHTAGDWTADEINIEANASYFDGMLSEIPASYWEDIEGIQRASFLRNKLTRSDTANNYDLHNGERLRGKTMQVVLKNTSTSETKLFAVEIIYTDSDF